MSVAAVVVLAVLAFVYVELAIFAGAYMYLKAAQNTQEQDKEDKTKIRAYSVAAGIFFPVTFAIIAAYKATERK